MNEQEKKMKVGNVWRVFFLELDTTEDREGEGKNTQKKTATDLRFPKVNEGCRSMMASKQNGNKTSHWSLPQK